MTEAEPLTADEVLRAVASHRPRPGVTTEQILRALLSEDEADMIICKRREAEEPELSWSDAKADLLAIDE